METKELQALLAILQAQVTQGPAGHIVGTWTIRYEKDRGAFTFDKCENEGYCEERPVVIAVDGTMVDEGGPLAR